MKHKILSLLLAAVLLFSSVFLFPERAEAMETGPLPAAGVSYDYTRAFLEKIADGNYPYVLNGVQDCAGYINRCIRESGIKMPDVKGSNIGYTGAWIDYIKAIGNGNSLIIGNTTFTARVIGNDTAALKEACRVPGTIYISDGHASISLGEFPSSWTSDEIADRLEELYDLSGSLNGNNAEGKAKIWNRKGLKKAVFEDIWRANAAMVSGV